MPSPPFVCTAQKEEIPCRNKPYRWLLRSRPPAMRSAAACCAGTGSASPGRTVWMHCWSILLPASRKARIIMTVCRILPARPAGSSWTLPFVCGCCWTRRTMPPARWTCWATRRTPLPPAMPATPSAPPATKLLTRQLQRTAHRQPCCSTKPLRRWRRATPVLPLRKTNWRSITARQRTT